MRRWEAAARWMFEDPRTGRLVIAQWPNLPLWLFLAAAAAERLLAPAGTAGTLLRLAGAAALVWWAVDEIVRGLSRFRRLLGSIVLVATAVDVVRRILG